MSFFTAQLRQSLLAQLGSRRTWLLAALLPLITFGVRLALPPSEAAAPVQVGVVLPREGGREFWEKLEERSGLVTVFLPAEEEEARRQVASGRWDCALILPGDFDQRLEELDTYGLFTLLTGPGSTVYPMVREAAASCVAELAAPAVAEGCLLDSGIVNREELEQVRPRLEKELEDRDRVLVRLETADGRALDPIQLADSGIDSLLAGLAAVALLIWALLAAMDLGGWLDSPAARRLRPLRGAQALLLPRLAGALCPALCSGALALLALERPLACLLALVPYLLFWGAAALALARWRPAWTALPVLMPFVPAAALLLSPVLVDLSLLFPALGPVSRWMPVTLYLRACRGSWGDGLALAAAGGGALVLLWALDRRLPSRDP